MRARILTTVILAAAMAGCTPQWARDSGNADVTLMMSSVLGQAGGSDAAAATQLLSDVLSEGSVFNDNAELTLRTFRKNPLLQQAFAAASGVNDVLLERYVVRYYRADGRSQPGVDVPFDISGEMSGRIPPEEELVTSIIVVRHQAKQEPPLRNIRGAGGQNIVTMFAEVTVFGRTLANKKVTASGRLEIVFADFADE
jgi:hypothetical protein